MTVAYLRATHCRRRPGLTGNVDRYAAGFRECAVHVGQYLLDAGVNFGAVHDRLMSHLDKALQAGNDVDGCRRLEPTADASTEKTLWTGDAETTGRSSSDSDDDDCESTCETVDDVIRRQYGTASVQLATESTTLMTTAAPMTYRQPLHPGIDADSPRSADEFPSFPPHSAAAAAVTATDDYSTSLPGHVHDDLVVVCDVGCDGVSRVSLGGDLKSSSTVVDSDTITDYSADVWRPWR